MPYDLSDTSWIAWQFDEPQRGSGVVQAFRRKASVYETAGFVCAELEPGTEYVVQDLDLDGSKQTALGKELMEHGLAVTITTHPAPRSWSTTGTSRPRPPAEMEQDETSACPGSSASTQEGSPLAAVDKETDEKSDLRGVGEESLIQTAGPYRPEPRRATIARARED